MKVREKMIGWEKGREIGGQVMAHAVKRARCWTGLLWVCVGGTFAGDARC
jgi:hypothetical protein